MCFVVAAPCVSPCAIFFCLLFFLMTLSYGFLLSSHTIPPWWFFSSCRCRPQSRSGRRAQGSWGTWVRTRRCSESESNAGHAASSSSVVNDTAHQHLSDLGQGDEHGKLPGDSETRRSQGLVRVHHGVHAVVHSHELTTPATMSL